MTKYFADLTIVADGQASKFRSQYTKHTPITTSRFWALKLIDAALPSHHIAYSVIGSGPPILIYQIGLHETRILIDIPSTVYESASRGQGIKHYVLLTSVVPDLPASVQPASHCSTREGGFALDAQLVAASSHEHHAQSGNTLRCIQYASSIDWWRDDSSFE